MRSSSIPNKYWQQFSGPRARAFVEAMAALYNQEGCTGIVPPDQLAAAEKEFSDILDPTIHPFTSDYLLDEDFRTAVFRYRGFVEARQRHAAAMT